MRNGKSYVGQTLNFFKRWFRGGGSHVGSLKRGNHRNQHLQRAWSKYGAEAFTFIILERCDPCVLNFREAEWIAVLHSRDPRFGYNIDASASGGARSEETRQRIGEANRNPSEETRRRMSEGRKGKAPWNKGLPRTEETKSKISRTRMVRNIPAPNSGTPHTEETKRKISEANRGKKRSEAVLTGYSERMQGRRHINNGLTNRRLEAGAALPPGWVYGRLKRQ